MKAHDFAASPSDAQRTSLIRAETASRILLAMRSILIASSLALLIGPVTGITASQTPALSGSANACPTRAVAQVADAVATKFDEHQFVLIHATHGTAKIDEFLICLVSRPAFTGRATDIVAEWASYAQQPLLDRYLLTLDMVDGADLIPIWFDTDTPDMWATLPTLRQLLATVRQANTALPMAKRIRLVGGNEGIQWANVQRVEDLAAYPFRTNWMEHLLIEHFAKTPGNRTLVVYGDGHIHHDGPNFIADAEPVVGRSALFVIGTVHDLREDERAWLSRLGDITAPFFIDASSVPEGPWAPSLRANANENSLRLSDYVDGVLYLGPERDRLLTGALPLTAEQQRELARRNSIKFGNDPQTGGRKRYDGRAQWFRDHPRELPVRP